MFYHDASMPLSDIKHQMSTFKIKTIKCDKVWSRSDQVKNLYVGTMNLLGIMRSSGRY